MSAAPVCPGFRRRESAKRKRVEVGIKEPVSRLGLSHLFFSGKMQLNLAFLHFAGERKPPFFDNLLTI